MTVPNTVAGIPAPTIQVIGTGFGRTGTLSLREALVRLGFGPCDHMVENFEHPQRFALWEEALRRKTAGEPVDWRPLLTGFQTIVDWPGAYFWRELSTAHPDAKVILTIRDPERWYDSAQATIFSEWTIPVNWDIVATGTFDGRLTDRAHCQAVFAQYNREVQETIAPQRLLVFEVKQGWEPLCAFLGVPVPDDEPFPHVNDTVQYQDEEHWSHLPTS